MKQLLSSPIMVNVEIGLIEDVIKLLGAAIHTKFSHDDVQAVKGALYTAGKKAAEDHRAEEAAEAVK